MSSLLFSEAEYKEEQETKTSILVKNIIIETPARKNEFTKRKKWLLEKINEDVFLEEYYKTAKEIFYLAAGEYSASTGKSKNSLFKFRNFDKDYLRPQLSKYFEGKESSELSQAELENPDLPTQFVKDLMVAKAEGQTELTFFEPDLPE